MIAIEAVVALPGPSELALSTGHLALSTGHLALLADHAGHGLLTSVTGEGDAGHSSPRAPTSTAMSTAAVVEMPRLAGAEAAGVEGAAGGGVRTSVTCSSSAGSHRDPLRCGSSDDVCMSAMVGSRSSFQL